MWETLLPAAIGLIGVLLGSVISTGASFWLAGRHERVEAAKEANRRELELRTAARLLYIEFHKARDAAMRVVSFERWLESAPTLEVWRRDAAVFAREMSLDDWSAVMNAAFEIENFQLIYSLHASKAGVDEIIQDQVLGIFHTIEAGVGVLSAFALDKPVKDTRTVDEAGTGSLKRDPHSS